MVEGDIFREIDEELKREQFAKLWDKYGYLVLGTAIAIVVSVAGYKYWNYRQNLQAQTFGSRFTEAIDLAGAGSKEKAGETFVDIASGGPRGYAMLSQLRIAASKAASGKLAEAIIAYDKLSENKSIDPVFRDFSRVQAAMLRVDDANEAEMTKRLGDMANGNGSWRHSARELLGLSAFKAKNFNSAENYYNLILAERAAPSGIRQRAEMMLSLIIEETVENKKIETGAEKKASSVKTPPAGNK